MSQTPFDNITQVVLHHARRQPEHPCQRFFSDGLWRDRSWGEVGRRVEAIAGGLRALGLEPGERVGIMGPTAAEWALADLGSLAGGCVVTTVYPTLPGPEAAYILAHSRCRLVFVHDLEQLGKIEAQRERLPDLKRVVLLEGAPSHPETLSLEELESLAGPSEREQAVAAGLAARRSTPLTVIYTSGTTGTPKGVVLTHGNMLGVLESVLEALGDVSQLGLCLSFLPLAHALERVGGHFVPMYLGATVAYARGLETLAEDLPAIQPDFAVSVPRVFEKVHAGIMAKIAALPPHRRRLAQWAIAVGGRRGALLEKGDPVPAWLALRFALADRLVLKKFRQALGGRLKLFISGGAALSANIARFFHGAGILVLEGWGATETSAPATFNTPRAFRFGSVGKPLPGVEVKIAPDGELLVKGTNVFAGYLDSPEINAQSFDDDGFYLTGDIGFRDEDGFFYITDRKKELIITASGKNISPQKLETLLKQLPLLSNCIAVGDGRPYITALITLDRQALALLHPELAQAPIQDPGLLDRVQAQIDQANQTLPRFEQIKYFRVVEPDFSPEGGELTLTLKLRRKVVLKKYAHLVDQMYR